MDHRQFVFTIPKTLRTYFKRNRYLLGDLAKCAWAVLKEFFRAIDPNAVPAGIFCIQSFGNLLNFMPHIHAIVANGYFVGGTFYPLGQAFLNEGIDILCQIFRDKVLEMLQDKELLSRELTQNILSWSHNSGFSVHAEVLIEAGNRQGMERLARYIMRNPVAQEKIVIGENGTIYYHAKAVNPNFQGNFRTFEDPLEFLAEVLQHVPPKNFHLARFFGAYSNSSRGKRNRRIHADDCEIPIFMPALANRVPRKVRKAWARLIAKIYEVNPMICPKCGGEMKIARFIEQEDKIRSTLSTLGLPYQPRGQPDENAEQVQEQDIVIIPDGEPFYDDDDTFLLN